MENEKISNEFKIVEEIVPDEKHLIKEKLIDWFEEEKNFKFF